MRIIAFGDSFTYGHGLKDCLKDSYMPGDKPSKFTYVSLLAEKLGCELFNFSLPGNSNHAIWYQATLGESLRQHEYHKDDIVIVSWSFTNRFAFSNDVDSISAITKFGRYKLYFDKVEKQFTYKTDFTRQEQQKQHKMFKNLYREYHSDIQGQLQLAQQMTHLQSFLENKVKTVIHSSVDKLSYLTTSLIPNIDVPFVWHTDVQDRSKALDGNHPGEAAHQEVAEIYNSILQERKIII
jgi:hypothetical protein